MGIDNRGHSCIARRAVEVLLDQFGKWPIKAAAEAIGITPATWQNWRDGTSKPNTDHLSKLFGRFGPKFIAYVTAPFEDAHLDLKQARLDAQIAQLLHEKSALETNRSRVRDLATKPAVEAARLVARRRGEDET